MTEGQTLGDHLGHSVIIRKDEGEPDIWALVCDTCGEYILEQYTDGMVLWN